MARLRPVCRLVVGRFEAVKAVFSIHFGIYLVTCLIIGCGYLGFRVATLWQQQGQSVIALTRKPERSAWLAEHGITGIVGDVTQPETLSQLPKADIVLVAVGMDRSMYSDVEMVYVGGLKSVLAKLPSRPKHLVYVSSTGVYGDFGGQWVDEESTTDPLRPGGEACLKAEQLIHESEFGGQATVLRFAGIYGPDRVPTKQRIESGDWKKLSSAGFLNLIHVDDGARIVDQVSKTQPAGETYLVSDGNPVLRRDYYSYIAECLGVDQIPWSETEVDPKSARSGSNKRISNKKLNDQFDIELQYPDYRSGLEQAMDVEKEGQE